MMLMVLMMLMLLVVLSLNVVDVTVVDDAMFAAVLADFQTKPPAGQEVYIFLHPCPQRWDPVILSRRKIDWEMRRAFSLFRTKSSLTKSGRMAKFCETWRGVTVRLKDTKKMVRR